MLLHPPPEAAADTDVERVRAAIAQLPPADRDLLVLRFAEDLPTHELAVVLGTTPTAVLRRLHHAGWVIEDLAGDSAVSRVAPPRLAGRCAELVEEEADAGITPLLAARLAAAVAGERPAADEHWRRTAFVRGVRHHADALLSVALVGAVALPMAASALAQL